MAADIVPEAGFTSEALLAHPQLQLTSGARVLIVRGEGGRELLKETFVAHGMSVETREVYRRVRPQVDAARVAEVEARWSDDGIDVVTATSIETLENLQAMLTERGRQLLSSTALLVPSRRIVAAAVGAGLRGERHRRRRRRRCVDDRRAWRSGGCAHAPAEDSTRVLPYAARDAHSHPPHLPWPTPVRKSSLLRVTHPKRREHGARTRTVA